MTPKQSAVKKLDRVFSEYIRKRDCKPTGRCISCGKIITFETSDCGHYINRKHMATRFDENNCNAQCRACNRFDEGNIQGYRRGLIEKIGENKTDMLEIKKFNLCHLSVTDLNVLIVYYKNKIKELG